MVHLLSVAVDVSPDEVTSGHPDEGRPTGTVFQPANAWFLGVKQPAILHIDYSFGTVAFEKRLLMKED